MNTTACRLTCEPSVVQQGCKGLKNRRHHHVGPLQREQYRSALYSKSMNSTYGKLEKATLTVNLISWFDSRNRNHGLPELKVRVSLLIQFLRLANTAPRELWCFEVHNPVLELQRIGMRVDRAEEWAEEDISRRE